MAIRQKPAAAMPTVASNRLSHGLTSRAIAAARASVVRNLARALMSEAPADSRVIEAAEALAEAILQLRAVRRARFQHLSRMAVDDDAPMKDVEHLLDLVDEVNRRKLSEAALVAIGFGPKEAEEHTGLMTLLNMPHRDALALRRLEDYERKAYSRYRKLVTRFDYAVIEASG